MNAHVVAILLISITPQDDAQTRVQRAISTLRTGGSTDKAMVELRAAVDAKGDLDLTADHLEGLIPLAGHAAVAKLVRRGASGATLATALKGATIPERDALLLFAPALLDPVPAIPAIVTANGARALRDIAWKGRVLDDPAFDALNKASQGDGPLAKAAKTALNASDLTDDQQGRLAPSKFDGLKSPAPTEPRKVKVFYGTDRAIFKPGWSEFLWRYGPGFVVILLAFVLVRAAFWMLHPRFTPAERWVRRAGLALGIVLLLSAGYGNIRQKHRLDRLHLDFSGERGPFHTPDAYCHFGTCMVGIPPYHEMGQLERPSLLSATPWEDPSKHVMILRIAPLEKAAFFNDLSEAGSERAFVFVHGFNVSFEDAALRTAQIAHDLEFDGAPIFFSWPSKADVLQYMVDEGAVSWATHHLKMFLRDVRRTLPRATIHLVAHSMGNRAMTEALRSLARDIPADLPQFQEVILAAPDIDAQTFRDDIIPALRPTAERVTLYCAPYDNALVLSRRAHGFPRAGDSSMGVFVAEGMETVDVKVHDPDILGHSYYGSVGPVLKDILNLMLHRKRPAERGLDAFENFWRLSK